MPTVGFWPGKLRTSRRPRRLRYSLRRRRLREQRRPPTRGARQSPGSRVVAVTGPGCVNAAALVVPAFPPGRRRPTRSCIHGGQDRGRGGVQGRRGRVRTSVCSGDCVALTDVDVAVDEAAVAAVAVDEAKVVVRGHRRGGRCGCGRGRGRGGDGRGLGGDGRGRGRRRVCCRGCRHGRGHGRGPWTSPWRPLRPWPWPWRYADVAGMDADVTVDESAVAAVAMDAAIAMVR